MADIDVADVAAEVQAHLDRWNAPPDDSGVTHLIGEQSQRGSDGGSLPEVPVDEDGDPDYDSMKNDDLKAHLEARGLSKSGNHDELVERLEDDDAESD
jgi:hypothetical protein